MFMIQYLFILTFPISSSSQLIILNIAISNSILTAQMNTSEQANMTLFSGFVSHNKSECLKLEVNTSSTICAVICGRLDSCQVAYWISQNLCYLCEFGSVKMITQKTVSSYVALKITAAYLPLGQPIQTCLTPNISLRPCETGWELFRRPAAFWCLKLVNKPINKTLDTFDQKTAVGLCNEHNSKISGAETIAELTYIIDKAFSQKNNVSKSEQWGVWFDGTRKTKCGPSELTQCNSLKGFKFNDKTLVSKSGYLFSEGEPNNKNGTQKCIVLRIGNVSTAHNHGTLDDVLTISRRKIFKETSSMRKISQVDEKQTELITNLAKTWWFIYLFIMVFKQKINVYIRYVTYR
ncbi:C-type LECtin [Caenorhabditis elegans]|uniref:C-type LECtin n=1 Tax=Caenorhabditis elegans TaxID=6239 RepID=Q22932_CAEEL|nr:C-type LECtin [Caenorhabditis elegans]CCD67741.2 C-type LECtin [Caenorhabditis elegans]|eukprot:NP_001343642.1 C-type LECtin [Caenorhabditis elegans]